jgi:putative membrane protein
MPFSSPELQAFAAGFPIALMHGALTIALFIAGAAIYCMLTPYKDVQLIRDGNNAAALSLGGVLISLAIPLSASLAASGSLIEVALWGVTVLAVQLLYFRLVDIALKGLPERIQEGDVPAAALLVGAKLSVAIILAAAVMG